MRLLRNLIIIIVVVLIFVFFFAGKGVFDDALPLAEIKGIVILEVKASGVYEYEGNAYITRADETEKFAAYMTGVGYTLYSEEDGYDFQKNGAYYSYTAETFWDHYTLFTPTGVKLSEDTPQN